MENGIYHNYYITNRCVFVHIAKAAGQSVSMALFGDKEPGHWSIRDFEWEDSKLLNEYFKFTIVRNPWDRLVSAYFYLKNTTEYENDQIFASEYLTRFSTFEEFVHDGLDNESVFSWVHFRTQKSFLINQQGHIDLDFIGRFENLEVDFRKIAHKLGKPDTLAIGKANYSKREDYKNYYNQTMVDAVYDKYKEDIEYFEYEF